MQIAPIFNLPLTSLNGCSVTKKQNNFLSVKQNNIGDSFSFTGKSILLSGYLNQINDNQFPDELYLNLDEVFTRFENEDKTYHRWERFPYVLGRLLAKRCDYLGLTKSAHCYSYGSSPDPSCGYPRTEFLSIREQGNDEQLNKSIEFNWTREYNELQEFFKGIPGKTFGAESDMNKIRKGLPDILRKQGWIK